MFEPIFENIRQKSPLVHNITNYVTVNDCANMPPPCAPWARRERCQRKWWAYEDSRLY